MKSLKNARYKYIAATATILIQLLLVLILNLTLSDMSSPFDTAVENDELLLTLQDIVPEEVLLPPSTTETHEQQSLRSEDEDVNNQDQPDQPLVKPSASAVLSNSAEEEEMQKAIETVIPAPSIMHPLTVDSVKVEAVKVNAAKKLKKNIAVSDSAYKEYIKNANKRREFNKANFKNINNFVKVYPYALKTKLIIDSLNNKLSTISNKSQRNKMISDTEKQLFKEYEKAVRKMSVSQGKLLLKLIARETDKTGYDIIKDFKGSLPASFWYGVGRLFGTDLKTEFHKEQEDSIIEVILDKYNKQDLY